jgi:hypothetical protein
VERTGYDGLIGCSLRARPLAKTFRILSARADRAALDTFVQQLPHRAVMAKLRPHMGASQFVFWTAAGRALPITWNEAITRLSSIRTPGI